jgi:hypothetical protein
LLENSPCRRRRHLTAGSTLRNLHAETRINLSQPKWFVIHVTFRYDDPSRPVGWPAWSFGKPERSPTAMIKTGHSAGEPFLLGVI